MTPEEQTLAVIDFKKFFSSKPLRVSKAQMSEMVNLPKKIASRASDVFSIDKPSKSKDVQEFVMKDFESIKDLISSPDGLETVVDMFSSIQDEDVRMVLLNASNLAIEGLNNILPINLSETLTGIDDRLPSHFEQTKMIRKIRVLQNPLYVFDLMSQGMLTGTEVEALELFYPTMLEDMRLEVLNQIVELKTDKDAKLPKWKNQQISTLLGVPRVNPQALVELQKTYQPKDVEEGTVSDIDPSGAEAAASSTQKFQK